MSVEFVTEKILKSNSKKEVTTLDIIINDSDTGRLPYMSRSGGERVKAALSVILALSEIKSSKAGVQLGFLFIDEPPFLDAPGVQAYCDALEAIQQRYGNLKVMAITHDPAMKSRFPQSVDVVTFRILSARTAVQNSYLNRAGGTTGMPFGLSCWNCSDGARDTTTTARQRQTRNTSLP